MEPPFSLNLPEVDPDIVYCVEIHNTSITTRALTEHENHLVSNCSVFGPHYLFTVDQADPRDLFQFTVTPRNNVEGAKNGTSSVINGSFLFQSKV